MTSRKDPSLLDAIRQAAPASVEYRLFHGDERVSASQIEARLVELGRSTGWPIAYRRVVSAFLCEELRRLAGSSS